MKGREIVGYNLKRLRVAREISQERLAYDSAVDRSYLSGIERGAENPTIDTLDRIAATLSVPLADLFTPLESEPGERPALKRGRKRRPS